MILGKKDKIALDWMTKNFHPNLLEIIPSSKYPYSIFFKKNGRIIMEQDNKNGYFYFDYNMIWSIFEDFFGYNYKEIQKLMKVWLEETLDLGGFTPPDTKQQNLHWLEETLDLGGFTPIRYFPDLSLRWKKP